MRLRCAFLPAILACIIPAASRAAPTTIPGKTIYGSAAWNASMNPITVTGDITIARGATLTIGKGTEVRFQENSDDTHWGWDLTRSEIIVYGTLKINGTEGEPVTLTSTGTAAMGWFGIVFSDNYTAPGATGTIVYCNIARSVYGINFTSCTPAAAARNCLINDVAVGMLFDSDSAPTITNCTVISAIVGFECGGFSAPAIVNCNVSGLIEDEDEYKAAVYATDYCAPVFTGCAFASGPVDIDRLAFVTLNDTTVARTVAGVVGNESVEFESSSVPSHCSAELDNCNIIGLGNQGNGIEWDDNLDILKVQYSRIGGFVRNVWARWGTIDLPAGIYHPIGPRFVGDYYGYCTNGDATSLTDASINFINAGAWVGMLVENRTDISQGIVTDIISIPSSSVTYNTLVIGAGMSAGAKNDPGDQYGFTPLGDYNNIDLGDLGDPDPYRQWPPGHVPSAGENEFYGVQNPACSFNIELETSDVVPPSLYQLEVWAENNWWMTTDGIPISRYIFDNNENRFVGKVHWGEQEPPPHDILASKRTYSISGRILDKLNEAVPGVRVEVGISAQFPGHTVLADITDEKGYYTVYGLLPHATAYVVKPTKLGYTFSPASRSVAIKPAAPSDTTGHDFTALLPKPALSTAVRADGKDGDPYGLPGRTNWGLVNEETRIRITGYNFRETPAVFLRGPSPGSTDTPCANVVWTSATQLSALVPAGMKRGDYSVRVVNPDGQFGVLGTAETPGFTITSLPVPVVTGISPSGINQNYRGPLTISGRNFLDGCTVRIGGARFGPFNPETSGTRISLNYAPGTLGTGVWPVVVVNPDGQTSAGGVTLSVSSKPGILVDTVSETYDPGSPLALIYSLWPGAVPEDNVVDPYIAVFLPSGNWLFYAGNHRWTSSPVPVYRGFAIGEASEGTLAVFTVGADWPKGLYKLYGGLNTPGKPPVLPPPGFWLSDLSNRTFTIR